VFLRSAIKFKLGIVAHCGREDRILFWRDYWIGDASFSQQFPTLFSIATDENATILPLFWHDTWAPKLGVIPSNVAMEEL